MRFIYNLLSNVAFYSANVLTNNRFGIEDIDIPPNARHVLVHVASLGEFKSVLPLIKDLKDRDSRIYVSVSVTSGSAYDAFSGSEFVDFVFRFPLDHAASLQRYMVDQRVELVIVSEQEYWYNLFRICKAQSVPLYMVGTKVYENHVWFNHYIKRWTKYLHYAHMYVKTETDRVLLENSGYAVDGIVGFMRLKQALEDKRLHHTDSKLSEKYTILCASIHKSDLAILSNAVVNTMDRMRWILVPHVVQKSLSTFFGNQMYHQIKEQENVEIVNTLGQLSGLYSHADITYVGGGFGAGIHNVLEPAVYGTPIVVGPKNQSFAEVQKLKECGQLSEIKTPEEFYDIIKKQEVNQYDCLGDLWNETTYQNLIETIIRKISS